MVILPSVGCSRIAQRGAQAKPMNLDGLMCPVRPWIISTAQDLHCYTSALQFESRSKLISLKVFWALM